jgi:hypothetical protein
MMSRPGLQRKSYKIKAPQTLLALRIQNQIDSRSYERCNCAKICQSEESGEFTLDDYGEKVANAADEGSDLWCRSRRSRECIIPSHA